MQSIYLVLGYQVEICRNNGRLCNSFIVVDKPIQDYSAEVWRDQVLSFIEEVVQTSSHRPNREPCTVVGNSLGGFTALYASASDAARVKNLVNGCILLNAAGRFRKFAGDIPEKAENGIWESIVAAFQRFVIGLSFYYTKRPSRIEQVLKQVYPVNSNQVDQELVDSIYYPALHPNAPEVFYRVIAKNGNGPPVFIDDLLSNLKVPLLLLWGSKDPWIRPSSADAIQELLPSALRVDVDAGHCPHDEIPGVVNEEILKFLSTIHSKPVESRVHAEV